MRESEGVLDRPKPEALVKTLGDYAVLISVFGWMDQAHSNFFKVRGEAIRRVKEAFDREGISMPEPIRNYRKLAPATNEDTEKRSEPSREDLAAVSDTRADPMIEQKVGEVRRSGEPDLLATDAPRE